MGRCERMGGFRHPPPAAVIGEQLDRTTERRRRIGDPQRRTGRDRLFSRLGEVVGGRPQHDRHADRAGFDQVLGAERQKRIGTSSQFTVPRLRPRLVFSLISRA